MTTARLLVAGLSLPLLAACSSGPSPAEQAYDDLAEATLELRDDFSGVPVTPASALPVTGSALYVGTAVIDVATPGAMTELIGDASFNVNFFQETVAGRLDGFYGTMQGGPVRAWNGSLDLSNGDIDVTRVNDIRADLVGDLTDGTNALTVDGAINGNFLGATAPYGLDAADAPGTAIILNEEDYSIQAGTGISILAGCTISNVFDC